MQQVPNNLAAQPSDFRKAGLNFTSLPNAYAPSLRYGELLVVGFSFSAPNTATLDSACRCPVWPLKTIQARDHKLKVAWRNKIFLLSTPLPITCSDTANGEKFENRQPGITLLCTSIGLMHV